MEDETVMIGIPRSSIGSALVRAIVAVVAVLALGPVAGAMAAGPEVKITSPSPESTTRNQTPPISGTTSDVVPLDQVTVTIYPGTKAEGTPAQPAMTATPSLEGFWSVTPAPALADGTYTALATQTDSLTLEAGSSTVTFRVDTTPPAVSVDPVPSPTNNRSPTLEGHAGSAEGDERAVTVVVYLGEPAEGNVAASGEGIPVTGGTWSYTPSSLADGTYTVQAIQRDEAGNQGVSAPVTFTVAAAPPTVTLNSPASPSSNTKPSFTGTASDVTPVTVDIYAGSTATGTIVSTAEATSSGGSWASNEASPALPGGQYTAVATEPSSHGNPAGVSSPVTFTVETAPPRVTLNAPASPSNNTRPSFTGTASDVTPVRISVYAGSSASGTVVSTAEATSSGGSWASNEASPALPSGQYTAVASEASSHGNPAGVSSPVTFTVDTAAPRVTLNAPASPSNNTRPSFTGTASDVTPVRISVYAGSSASGTVVSTAEATPDEDGKWASNRASPALPSGQYTAVASEASSLGNPAGVSSPVTFTVDTAAPRVTLNAPASPSNNTRPSFRGTASDVTPVTVDVYAGSTASGPVVSTAEAASSGGSWSSSKASPALPNGQYTAVATEPSSLGNPAGVSSPVRFTVDTAAPSVTLDPPASPSKNTAPSFTGSASDVTPVTVEIYVGSKAKEGRVVSTAKAMPSGGSWVSGGVSPALPDGQYTATATQKSSVGNHPGVSESSTFWVDTTPPQITLISPTSGSTTSGESQTVTGAAGVASGDLPAVTIQLFAGSTVGAGEPLESVTVNAPKGPWSATLGGLGAGTYTVRATQRDQAGNLGVSGASTFTVASPGGGSTPHTQSPPVGDLPPAASFTFFPTAPRVGENVSLASSSTDATSPIVAYAWDLAGGGVFQPRGPVVVTSFATPGSHVVHLRVTAADGLSSVVAQTIQVAARRLPLMQPFPIVRIVGSDTHMGARLSLLSAQVPVGARVSVRCRGRGCPIKVESRIAAASRHRGGSGTVAVAFRRFERSLRAGVSLEIRVSKPGEIGKYTRFGIRRNKPPVRIDACLDPTRGAPIVCPSS